MTRGDTGYCKPCIHHCWRKIDRDRTAKMTIARIQAEKQARIALAAAYLDDLLTEYARGFEVN